ncbi:MAG: O-antigen ligase family protein, partial [Caulobacterales bacterium]|nr:O-antigen ligase family protein [Caulobacterales bacterium]
MLQPVHLARFGAVVLFTAIATGGWDNRFAAAALAATLLAIALLLAPTRGGRRALGRAPLPWRAGAGFACVMALGLLQVALAAAVWPDAALFLNENGLNAPGAVDLFAAQVELVKLAGLGAAFILGMAAGRGQAEFDRVLAGVTAAGLVYVLYALGVHAFAAFGPIPPQRLLGGLGSANVAAGVLHVVMFIAARGVLRTLAASSGAPLSFYDRARQVMRERPISTPALVLATIALLLTASRAGVAMGAGGLLVLIAWAPATRLDQSITRRRGLARIAIAIGVAAIVGSIFGDRLEQRFETYDELSDPRFALFQAHGAAIADRPWLGYGYGSFQSVNNAIMTAQNARALEPA